MPDIIFWGAAGQAKVLREALEGTDVDLVALVDNRQVPSPFPQIPTLYGMAGLQKWLAERGRSDPLYCSIAVGGSSGHARLELMRDLESLGLIARTIIHRTAFIASDAEIARGCQVLAQAAVCSQAVLKETVIVNTGASVDHECFIGAGAHIAPGAVLAGEVQVGLRAFIGAGAVVLPRLKIGDDAIVGAGAVVTKDVAAGSTVIGNPARPYTSKTPRQATV